MYGQLFEAGLLDKDQNIEWTGTESASVTQVAQSAVIEAEWRPMNVPTYREWTPSYLNAGSDNEPAEFYAGPATAVAVAEPVTQPRDWRDRIDEQAESESLIMN